MKFAAGYQQNSYGEPFSEILNDYSDSISEVYFPWISLPSGRPPLVPDYGETEEDARDILISELRAIRAMGIRLDILFNANCYGDKAVSKSFEAEIKAILEELTEKGVRPDVLTTTSIFVADVIKNSFPDIRTRASVNMRIGTVQAMGYASDLFDGFYLQRDRQRDLSYVREVSAWCRENGKDICMLVNSGCLRFCPGQVFHDNLIAHCQSAESDRKPEFNPHICWRLYEGGKNPAEILKSTWIRPEDVHNYAPYIDVFKLATRQHAYPRSVISAYVNEKWDGNLLELLEPGYTPAFFPKTFDNASFPEDFWEKVSHCTNGCSGCGYCESILEKVFKTADESSIVSAGF